jgi:hypothetical protein
MHYEILLYSCATSIYLLFIISGSQIGYENAEYEFENINNITGLFCNLGIICRPMAIENLLFKLGLPDFVFDLPVRDLHFKYIFFPNITTDISVRLTVLKNQIY